MSRNLRILVLALSIFLGRIVIGQSAEQAAPADNACASYEELKTGYLKDNQYNVFIDALENPKGKFKLSAACLNYYKALARYSQLKYLEEKQLWDDYFANGNTYRDQIVQFSNNVISQAQAGDPLRVQSRLLLWKFHHDQQDAFAEDALTDLMTDLDAYAKGSVDPALLKNIADELKANDEKSKARQAYKLYVGKLIADESSEPKLKTLAAAFYKEENLELAENVYDVYIEKISKTLKPEQLVPELLEIASMFVYKPTGLYDMPYAEKIYAKLEGLGKPEVFNQETIYLRAFNLEKMKEYKKAREIYLQLIKLYADTRHFDEAVYKIAMVDAYVLADLKEARAYFEKLTAKPQLFAHKASSLYQLGLLAQWEGDLTKAKDYYNALIKDFSDTQAQLAALTKERLKEIEENKPLEYNLKIFLDLSLKPDAFVMEMGKAELQSSSYILEKNRKASVSSVMNMPESGCNQVELQYLWSGNLGDAHPTVKDATFEESYTENGTKETNLVVVSPSGTLDRSFIMEDVY